MPRSRLKLWRLKNVDRIFTHSFQRLNCRYRELKLRSQSGRQRGPNMRAATDQIDTCRSFARTRGDYRLRVIVADGSL